MDARNPDTVLTGDSDEISLSDLIRSIWSSRAFAVGGLLLGGGIAASATLLNYWMTPQSETYRQQIALNVDGTYPNGTAFSVNDLRSPAVLQRVFTEKGLDEYGISYADFAAEVAITPSSSVYDSVVERYRARLNDQSLSYAERQQIEAEFSSALGASLASGATIAVTIPGEFGVPRNVGRSVPVAIANTWADIYIHQLGGLDFPVPNTSSELISAEFVAGLDYPIAYDALVEAFDTLEERLDLIGALAGSNNLTEPETGRTLYDIGREVFNLRNFSLQHVLAPLAELGVNRSPELTIAAYAYQLQELDREIQLAERNAGLIDAVLTTERRRPDAVRNDGNCRSRFRRVSADRDRKRRPAVRSRTC